jgi:Fe-S cluster assembly scaffold protein SufB
MRIRKRQRRKAIEDTVDLIISLGKLKAALDECVVSNRKYFDALKAYHYELKANDPNLLNAEAEVLNNPDINSRYLLKQNVPGMLAKVKNPVTGNVKSIWLTVQDLNDSAKWSREQIADWLDTLEVDLSIPASSDTLTE